MSIIPPQLAKEIAKINKEAADARTKKLHPDIQKLNGILQSPFKDSMMWGFKRELGMDTANIKTPYTERWKELHKLKAPHIMDGKGKFLLSLFTKGDITNPKNVGSPTRGGSQFKETNTVS